MRPTHKKEVSCGDLHIREAWKAGSPCQVYSRSQGRWFKGRIVEVLNDDEGEWLKVKYKGTHYKQIQRLCHDIVPLVEEPVPCQPTQINFTNMPLSEYVQTRSNCDQLLIRGYLRLQSMRRVPSVIRHLIYVLYHSSMDISEFTLKRSLGAGTFGNVRLCQHSDTRNSYAIKILNKKRMAELEQERHIANERSILAEIKHPFIISLMLSFEDTRSIYLVFELLTMGCEFFDLLQTYERLNTTQCVFYASQVVLIFEYLHSKHIVYRDLKPENLMYGSDGYLKLIDFGFSTKVDRRTHYCAHTLCGTPHYLSPEQILNKGHSFGVDWWALGILIFEMYTGFTPFESESMVNIYSSIIKHSQHNQHEVLQYLQDEPDLHDIVRRLLCSNPRKRLGKNSMHAKTDDIRSHAFFSRIDWSKIYHKQYTNAPKHSPVCKPCPVDPVKQQEMYHDAQYLDVMGDGPFLYDF